LIALESVSRIGDNWITKDSRKMATLDRIVGASRGTPHFVALIDRFSLFEKYPELLALAQERPEEQIGADAARTLLAKRQLSLFEEAFAGPMEAAINTAKALGTTADDRILPLLWPIVGRSRGRSS
jgi:hypothetical protein